MKHKLTGAVQDFREEAGEADIVLLHIASYFVLNYKTTLTFYFFRKTDSWTHPKFFEQLPYHAVHEPSRDRGTSSEIVVKQGLIFWSASEV
jgi:hypothetical protein